MNENQTNQSTAEVDPDEFLTQGLTAIAEGKPISGLGDKSTENTETEVEEVSLEDRGTQDEKVETKPTKVEPKQAEPAKAATTKDASRAPNSDSGKQETRKPSRYETRIQELVGEIKGLKAQLAKPLTAQTQQATLQVKQEPRAIIPPPQKPQYSIEQLNQTKNQILAKTSQGQELTDRDREMVEMINGELQAWKDYQFKNELWEVKNGQAVERWQANQNYYRAEAIKTWPELADGSSPLYTAAVNLAQKYPEILNRSQGDGEYVIANVASLVLKAKNHESELGTLKQQNETLTKENETLKKKLQPATQKDSPETGKTMDADEENLEAAFSRKFRELRAAQKG